MTYEEAIEILRDTPIDIRSTREDDIHTLYATAQLLAIEALEKQRCIDEIIDLVADCNDGEIPAEIICRKLYKYGLIDRDENNWLIRSA